MLRKLRAKYNKGTGEMLGLSIVSLIIVAVLIALVAIIQYSYAVDSVVNATNVSARAAALCNSFSEARDKTLTITENSNTNPNVSEIKVIDIKNLEGNDWRTGDMIEIKVTARIHTILPILSGVYETSSMVVIENRKVDMNRDLSTVEGKLVDIFSRRGYSQAAIAAMLSYIYDASGYSAYFYDPDTERAGLCGWRRNTARFDRLMEAGGNSGILPELDVQLEFIQSELDEHYMGTDTILMNTGDDIEEAYYAAAYVWQYFGLRAPDTVKIRDYIDGFYRTGYMHS